MAIWKWWGILREQFGLEREDAQSHDNYALTVSCGNGHLELVKYLKEEFGLEREDAQIDDNYALRWSCANGYSVVVKYLKEEFGLVREDAQSDDNFALGVSCENGNLEVVKYLREEFGLEREDAQSDNNYALRLSLQMGIGRWWNILGKRLALNGKMPTGNSIDLGKGCGKGNLGSFGISGGVWWCTGEAATRDMPSVAE
jgi:hypothetical protein